MFGRFLTLVVALVAIFAAFATAASCDTKKNESSCTSAQCTWCTSGAVGASCMSPEEAAGLPSSVFTCTTSVKDSYFFLSTSSCENITKESSCESNADCAWCSSGAVGSSCMSASDAQGLPSSIFSCTYGKKKVASTEAEANTDELVLNPWLMGDVEYGRTHAKPSVTRSSGVKASAAGYVNDPLGYSTLYFSEYAYCLNYMTANYNSNKYTSGFVPTLSFTSGKSDSIVGFVGYLAKANAIIVSYRGSENIQNWITNLSFIRTDYPNCSGCSVHDGFYKAEQEVLPQIKSAVAKLHSAHPTFDIVLTGHSLGAALATLTAMDLAPIYGASKVKLYNYGSPRMFNQAGADYASSGVITIGARRSHYKDIVVHQPPQITGFSHIVGEIYEDGPSSKFPVWPGGTLRNCNGEEDKNCADQYDGASVADHLLYSGLVMGGDGCNALK